MPHSLRVRLKNLQRKGELTEKDIDRIFKALEQKPETGYWIEIAQYSDGKHKIECSECKSHIFDRGHANSFNVKNRYKYCPNCGCTMTKGVIRDNG